MCRFIYRRKFGSQISDKMDRWKAEQKTLCFPMICGFGRSKSRLAKAAGAEPAGQMRDEKLHAIVARSTFPSQNVQNTPARTTFGSWDVEKVHAVVARSTCRSQNVQETTCTRHFWRFRCRFAWQAQGIVRLVQNGKNVRVLSHFQLQPPLHHTTLQYTSLQLQLNLHYIPLHYTPLHYTAFNCIQLHYTSLHYTTLLSTKLHYTTLHSTTLQLQLHNYTTTLHYTKLHYVHYTTLHYTTLHYTTFHYTTRHYTTLNDTAPQIDR